MNLTLQPEIDQQPTQSDAQSKSSLTPINFFKARHQLILESQEKFVLDRMTRTIQNESARGQLFMASNLAQEALYWFMWAPALVYLIYVILGLSSRA